MKKIIALLISLAIIILARPTRSLAAGGIYASGGQTVTVGQSFTVTVTASGASFNAAQGKISISGPVSVTSFSAGSASNWTWTAAPTNGGTFVGVLLGAGQRISSLTIATIKLKGTGVGSGSVSVSGVALEPSAGSGSGGTNFTIQKAADLPGGVTISSSSHPDQNTAYDATTIILSWDKASGVDGFSYLLDQSDGTVPPAKVSDTATSANYADKPVGVYYFHIRAHKPDGFGTTSQFKITIKEPDPKINSALSKPHNITISRAAETTNDISLGMFTGIVVSGVTEPNFTANLTLDPKLVLLAGKTLSVAADKTGQFSLTLDFPVRAGTYQLSVQGQDNKTLTPVSDSVTFEITQTKGGAINILTDADKIAPATIKIASPKWYEKTIQLTKTKVAVAITLLTLLIVLALTAIIIWLRRKGKKSGSRIQN